MGKPKILLVDDTKLVLELEKSFLKISEVEVLTASNGAEALEMIRQDPPDLVFMDMNMPVMDGITCCSQIKSDPFLSEIPVIMLTTVGREGDRERALKAGCDDYLTKPIDRREFLEKARKFTQSVDRRNLRLPCHIPVIFLIGKQPFAAHALDVSHGGLFLASREPVHQDTPLKLALYLPAATPQLFEVSGRIAWVNPEAKRVHSSLPAGFGVEFLDLDEKTAAVFASYLEAEASSRSCDGTP